MQDVIRALARSFDGVPWEHVVAALLHSLWQAAALAAVAWIALRRIQAGRTNLRYAVALGTFLAVLPAAMVTFHIRSAPRTAASNALPANASPDLVVTPLPARSEAAPAETSSENAHARVDEALVAREASPPSPPPPAADQTARDDRAYAVIATVWLAGALLMLTRAAWLLVGASRLRRGCQLLNDDDGDASIRRLTGVVAQLRRTMRIARPVRLAAGPHVRVPAVFGVIAPVILLPPAIVTGLPVEQLRMVLAHELAHVRRHDYLVNLLQLLLESLLFFNPAVWWLSRQVRIEREACCDALAVAATGSGGVAYVRSLADVIGNLIASQAGLRLTPAVTGEGDMIDRAKRVLVPTHRPAVRLPWYTLAVAAVAAAALLAGMWRGTEAVVQAAEQLVSPRERVERMADLQRQIAPPDERGEGDGEGPEVELTGTVRTADGKPLPPDANLTARSTYRHGISAYSVALDTHGWFSKKVRGRQAQVWVQASGYAPTISPALRVGADGKFAPVELVLDEGFDARVRLVGRDERPLANAPLRLAYVRPNAAASDTFAASEHVTGPDGVALIPHARSGDAHVTLDLPGYEQDRAPVQLDPKAPSTIRLTPAKPTTGVIVDAQTGRPIAGAAVGMVQRAGFDGRTWYPHGRWDRPPLMARTEGDGRFAIDRLRADCTYALIVAAEGRGSLLVQGVRAGESGLRWALGPPRIVTVQVKADPGQMPAQVSVSNPLVLAGTQSYDHQFDLPVAVKDGIGTAILTDPLPGRVRFMTGGGEARAEVADEAAAKAPVVIDLRKEARAPATRPATREVIVKLDWPKDGAEPRGTLRVDYVRADRDSSYWPGEAEIRNGEARIAVPVPTKLSYSQGGLVGYWVDDRAGIEVPPGDGPFEIPVRVEPAGAVHGTVADERGEPFTRYFAVSLVTVKPAPDITGERRPATLQPYNANDESPRYLLAPLPLGGTYRLVASTGPRVAVSDAFTVDARQPIRSVDLKFAPGVTLAGRVTDAAGTPVTGLKVELGYETRADPGTTGRSSSSTSVDTDRDGRFAFEHVDPTAADYSLTVRPGPRTHGRRWAKLPVPDGRPLDLRVGAGSSVRGQIIDVDTGKGLAAVRVTLVPKDESKALYPAAVTALAGPDGRFEATGLEPTEYIVGADGTYPPTATILRDAAGRPTGVRTSGTWPDGPIVKAGQADPVEVKRRRSPWN